MTAQRARSECRGPHIGLLHPRTDALDAAQISVCVSNPLYLSLHPRMTMCLSDAATIRALTGEQQQRFEGCSEKLDSVLQCHSVGATMQELAGSIESRRAEGVLQLQPAQQPQLPPPTPSPLFSSAAGAE